jgi:DNA-binding transcriptional regulator YiaG
MPLPDTADSVVCEPMRPQPQARGSFAAKLRQRLGDRTYEEGARAIGVSRRTFENWAQGRYVPAPFTQKAALERL